MNNMYFTLYRLYDKDEELLYIGKTLNVIARLSSHKTKKNWWNKVRIIELAQYDSISELATAEKIAIKSEKPIYNIIRYNEKRTKDLRGANIGYYELACEWLVDVMEPGKLYRATGIVERAFKENIAGKRTLERAKADLGIASVKKMNKWYWIIDID